MKKIIAFIILAINDLLFIIGATLILIAVYRFNVNIGLIMTGVFFMFYSLLISLKRR